MRREGHPAAGQPQVHQRRTGARCSQTAHPTSSSTAPPRSAHSKGGAPAPGLGVPPAPAAGPRAPPPSRSAPSTSSRRGGPAATAGRTTARRDQAGAPTRPPPERRVHAAELGHQARERIPQPDAGDHGDRQRGDGGPRPPALPAPPARWRWPGARGRARSPAARGRRPASRGRGGARPARRRPSTTAEDREDDRPAAPPVAEPADARAWRRHPRAGSPSTPTARRAARRSMAAAIAGISGAPRLLMTATTVPMKISTGTRARGKRTADMLPESQAAQAASVATRSRPFRLARYSWASARPSSARRAPDRPSPAAVATPMLAVTGIAAGQLGATGGRPRRGARLRGAARGLRSDTRPAPAGTPRRPCGRRRSRPAPRPPRRPRRAARRRCAAPVTHLVRAGVVDALEVVEVEQRDA